MTVEGLEGKKREVENSEIKTTLVDFKSPRDVIKFYTRGKLKSRDLMIYES